MLRVFWTLSLFLVAASSFAIQPDPIYRETEVRNERPRAAGEKFDPKEANPEFRHIFSAADKIAERRVGNVERNDDFIHTFWEQKKSILRDLYGIQWQSPADLNPDIEYSNYGQPAVTEKERQNVADYLASEGHVRNESINKIWRTFEGTVHVSTTDNKSDRMRDYELSGIGTEWQLISVYFVEY